MPLTSSALAVLAAALLPLSCGKIEPTSTPAAPRSPVASPISAAPAPAADEKKPPRVTSSEVGVATWYDPSEKSLAARRAPGELTAASDRLPMGSTVRVVNLSNGKSVLVRITDRGVHRPRAIDLCKDAAIELGLVGKGVAKVRVERFDAASEIAADPRP